MCSLERFITAQDTSYEFALNEIKAGRKKAIGSGIYFLSLKIWDIVPTLSTTELKILTKLKII